MYSALLHPFAGLLLRHAASVGKHTAPVNAPLRQAALTARADHYRSSHIRISWIDSFGYRIGADVRVSIVGDVSVRKIQIGAGIE